MRRVLIWLVLASMLGVGDWSWFAEGQTTAMAAPHPQVPSTTVDSPLASFSGVSKSARAPKSLTVLTNSFGPNSADFGTLLVDENVGGADPLSDTNTIPAPFSTNAVISIGTTNSWHFYSITNETEFTNAVFLTFLSRPPPEFPVGSNPLARADMDIDLYVSRNPALTNLDGDALAQADVSLGRGGSETILYSDATSAVYYIAVKCESALGARYNLAVDFSPEPFFQSDGLGNEVLRGFPAPTATLATPAYVLHVTPDSFPVRRVIVTNMIDAASASDLQLLLTHQAASAVLRNHSGTGPLAGEPFIYDDTNEHDISGAHSSDGPGTLHQFGGKDSSGQWLLSLTSTNQPATNVASWIYLERQPDSAGGLAATVLPGSCREDYVNVAVGGATLSVTAAINSGSGPLSMQVYPSSGVVASNCPILTIPASSPSTGFTVDQTSQPPLRPGQYTVVTCNLGPDPVELNLQSTVLLRPLPVVTNLYTSTNLLLTQDMAFFTSSLMVTDQAPIVSIEVGVRLDHSRVSDLVLSLLAPDGHRVLLDANRGGPAASALGATLVVTSTTPVDFFGGPQPVTNLFDTGQNSGSILLAYDFFALPDEMRVYYESNLLFDSGMVSFAGSTNLQYGPGAATVVTVVMNPETNSEANTAWHYSATTTAPKPQYLTFSENTNLTIVPMKFAPVPFTNQTIAPDGLPSGGIFYSPEESLNQMVGRNAMGQWTLEIWDRGGGGTNPSPKLVSWNLALVLANVVSAPVNLSSGTPVTNLLGPGQLQWYSVLVPDWISFATNTLLSSTAPVNIFFNETVPPTGTNTDDLRLASAVTNGSWSIRTNGAPGLVPGATYYLAIQNTNPVTVTVSLDVAFDVPGMVTLSSGAPFVGSNAGPLGSADYYRFVASTNAVRLQFEVNGPTADVTLLARKGVPPPSLFGYDYISANPGTNDELIVVEDFSQSVSLNAGEWFLTVANVTGQPVTYSILATEFSVAGTNLAVIGPVVSSNSICVSWSSLPGVHYFVEGKTGLGDASWTRLSTTITATEDTTSFCLPLPSPYEYFRVSEGLVLVPSPPILTSVAQLATGTLLQWSAPTNNSFVVQWTGSLTPAAWHPFPGVVTSTDGTFLFIDNPAGGAPALRFYRLEQAP
jgi:subtilisin-like proprotein convertase family protein